MANYAHGSRGETQEKEMTSDFSSWLFAQTCEFVAGATSEERLPDSKLPEVAFIGRSNVGKSSLINSLTNRNTLARTSKTPGRTQQINFFKLGESLMLVDLPGYGYARASKSKISNWTELIYKYLRGRQQLQRAYILIDARRGIKQIDQELIADLDNSAVSYQIVLTKCDKVTSKELEECIELTRKILKKHPAAFPDALTTSSTNKSGIADLRSTIASFAVDIDRGVN